MTTLRRLCAVTVLTCLLAVTTCAGDMSAGSGYTPPPPPAPLAAVEPTEITPGPSEVKTQDDPPGGELWEAVLALLRGAFSTF